MNIPIEKLNLPVEILRELAVWQDLPEPEVCTLLQTVFLDAWKYRKLHHIRHERALERSIRWGAEYHSYLQKYLTAGRHIKTAKTAAKRDFIAAHPITADSDEYPGFSNPALRRYHQAYLNTIPKE